eukprot:CAMPEP_0182421196 /NCGR_PEP_ID=MMETSP1167-20130531/6458_1 /TAXON_ID=2988 /ORGANISM="Mallomonas Sp, Strain CCMP3275" /LENGTH=108 /DNA_ID=CAMNT_0024598071 /DNA_START=530 /DNA_END=856 /DNA_ORIENTATION=+
MPRPHDILTIERGDFIPNTLAVGLIGFGEGNTLGSSFASNSSSTSSSKLNTWRSEALFLGDLVAVIPKRRSALFNGLYADVDCTGSEEVLRKVLMASSLTPSVSLDKD